MLVHLVVALTAAVVTAGSVPLVARLARRLGAIDVPADPRKVHRDPVPTLGGLAMLLGVLAGFGVAWWLGGATSAFVTTSEPMALLAGVVVIVLVGVADDVVGLPPTVKLAGQIVASLGVAVFGIQLVYFWLPGLDIISLSPDLGLALTMIALVAMINAVNLIDGLDGLAAGVVAIAGLAFFAFVHRDQAVGLVQAEPTAATLAVVLVIGTSLGFLVHNWHPARIFMGDTGAMLLGLLLGAAGIAHVGRSAAPTDADFFGAVPLFVPALVLAIPFLDTALAITRRTVRGQPLSVADKEHLHHLLLAFGHSHRRAVLVLWYWSALLAATSIGPAYLPWYRLLPWLLVGVVLGVVATLLGTRTPPSSAAPAEAEERTRPRRTG